MPRLSVVGKIDNVNLSADDPVTGNIILKVPPFCHKYSQECSDKIVSIEVQLARSEKFELGDQMTAATTEIQNLQIADGNVPTGLELPIYVVLPRYFSCACFELSQASVRRLLM